MWLWPQEAISSLIEEMETSRYVLVWVPQKQFLGQGLEYR